MSQANISVVIPFYNSNEYLEETLLSISTQSVIPKEVIIVVDIGSESPVFTRSNSYCIRVLNNNSGFRGAGVCRWIGYSESIGNLVAFLDSDDLWKPDRLEAHLYYIEANHLVFSCALYSNFWVNGAEHTTRSVRNISKRFSKFTFLSKMVNVGCLTVIVDKSILGKIACPKLFRRNDYEMWYDICSRVGWENCLNSIMPCEVGYHRVRNESLSSNKFKSALYQWKLYRTIGLTPIRSFFFVVFYFIFTIYSRS